MTPNPPLGVFFHWLGGLASVSFYVRYRVVGYGNYPSVGAAERPPTARAKL